MKKKELSASARPWRDGLIILISAVLVAGIAGYFAKFPFKLFEPVVCIQPLIEMFRETCYPSKILWTYALLDLAFWFVVLVARKLFRENKRIIGVAVGIEILGYLSALVGYPHALSLMLGFAFLAPTVAAFFAKDKIIGRFLLGFIIVGGKLVFDLTLALVLLTVFPPHREELGMVVGFGIPILVTVILAGLVGAVVGGVFGIIKEKSKMAERELVSILILAVLVTVFLGYFIRFPLSLTEPVSYMERSRITGELIRVSEPARINLDNAFLDFLFWFLVLTAGWWVAKKLKISAKGGSASGGKS